MIDSLTEKLISTGNSHQKIELINELSFEYIWRNADSAIVLADRAIELNSGGDKKLLAESLRNLSLAQKIKGSFSKAIRNINKAIQIYTEEKDSAKLAQSYKDLGDIYHSQGDDEPKSVDFLLQAVKLSEKIGDDKIAAACYNNLALAYRRLEEYDNAIKYLNKSIEVKEKLGNRQSLVYSLVNLGIIYKRTSQTGKALEYYNKALDIAREFDNKVHIAAINNNLSLIYKEQKEFSKARKAILEAKNSFENINDGTGIAISYYNLAELGKDMGNYKSALYYAGESLNKAHEIDAAEQIMDAYKILYEVYSLQGYYQKAFKYLSMYKEKSDSVFNEEKYKQITEIQTKYETAKKEQQIELLEKEKMLSESIIAKQTITIFSVAGILVISILFSGIVYRQYKSTVIANKELVKKNLELMKNESSVYSLKQETVKYSDNVKQDVLDKLNRMIEDKKIFKTQKLSIDNLAKQLDTNRTYLSEIINEVYNTNFNQFINSRRVIEARKMLVDPDYVIYTIEAIAKEVGFSSKSVFHKAFKQFTGISPSFFRENARNNST